MIKRYLATKDNTITNAYGANLDVRGKDANMGQSDILEVFTIYGQTSSSVDGYSLEEARILIQFDIEQIKQDIADGIVPQDAKFYLKLFNAEHGQTVPRNFTLEAYEVSGAWQEGYGLDMEDYTDSTGRGVGSSWLQANNNYSKAIANVFIPGATIVLEATETGRAINGRRFQIDVLTPTGTDYVVTFLENTSGTLVEITSPAAGPNLTTTELAELINTGSVSGKTIILTDSLNLRTLQTATATGTVDLEVLPSPTDLAFGDFAGGAGEWASEGGDFYITNETAYFEQGLEDLEIDIASFMTDWDSIPNDGILIKFPDTLTSMERSFYTKKFFARSSNHFFKRPIIEARWDSSQFDDRNNFFTYSSMSSQNNNTLYLYNYQRGQLTNIPSIGTGPIYVDLYETLGETALIQCIDTPATGGWVSTGIYTASVCIDSTAETLYDVWHDGASSQFHTGTIEPKSQHNYSLPPAKKLVVSQIDKLDKLYSDQVQRFYFNIREKGWSPNIYVVATAETESLFFNNLIYRIIRPITKETIINYDLIDLSTLMSYDSKGNYFDLDLNLLEPNEVYEIKLALFNPLTKSYEELNFSHKFRVVNNEY